MKITEISLKHYRGAESLQLKLGENLNVFAGVNGSGKSTVLDSIAIMLSWAVSRIKSVGASGRPISEADIMNGYSSALIEIICTQGDRIIEWKLSKSRKGHGSPDDRSNLNNLSEFTKQIQSEISAKNENINLPLFAHYSVNRAVLDIPLKIRKKHSFDLLNVYDESLTSGANFRTFFEWFREREDLENENSKHLANPLVTGEQIVGRLEQQGIYLEKLSKDLLIFPTDLYISWQNLCVDELSIVIGKNSDLYTDFLSATSSTNINSDIISNVLKILSLIKNHIKSHDNLNLSTSTDSQLEIVRNALQKFLPEFTNFNIRRSPLRMEVKKDEQILTVNQLSDGEKCLIALVGDLARRMAIANTMRQDPLQGDGIVLIDEVDLHLHPRWQRTVILKLTEVFPNCQFIISTHSPHVINHVHPENLFLLDRTTNGIVATHPLKSYGNNVDRILEDLMGLQTTRTDDVFQELRDIYNLISQNSLSDATNKIVMLKQKIGTDPELVKAEVLIKRKNQLANEAYYQAT
jgi:predicted ATP-binding protein involved in virulence